MAFYRPPTNQGTLDALGFLYRALRAWRFYPKGHPSRSSSIKQAHAALQELLDGNTLLLSCGRAGFSFPDGEFLKDTSGVSAALAYELFVRRVQKITFFYDLFQEDLLELCKILCLSPDVIKNAGGIDILMAERGIRSIWVNEFDLTTLRSMRKKIERSGILPKGLAETEDGADLPPFFEETLPQPTTPDLELQLQTLFGRLATCDDDDTYLILARQVVSYADMLPSRHEPHLLFSLFELFASHAVDISRSENMRECALFAIEQILANGAVLQQVLERVGQNNALSNVALLAVLKAGGATAIVAAIELVGRTGNLKSRKTVSTVLGKLGEAAVPVLLNLLNDPRWFITRNICAILGVIKSSDSLTALITCLQHADLRVRKEAIRSLAQIGGQDAEAAIIGVLRGKDTELYPQAISSLGGMKSRKSLPELMRILLLRDMFLKSLSFKTDILAAIALIGDRQVTPQLLLLLEEGHLLAAVRGRKLKLAIASCLGKLGDTRAIPDLEKLAAGGGELGSGCLEALAMIENGKE
jgi:HEAT repeat protein